MTISLISSQDTDFQSKLAKLLSFESTQNPEIEATVAQIINQVRVHQDSALLEYTNKFDHYQVENAAKLELSHEELKFAYDSLSSSMRDALNQAISRVRAYHQKQLASSWSFQEEDGTILGQQISALDRVGIYVPGGKAAYPSSVWMNAIPAQVAGVGEIIMVVPTPNGERNDLVLAAAYQAGVHRAFTVGGAQAIAALAYGTQTIPAVDKISGPGNAYVAAAKRKVFGNVGIDMVAGPSEILIICDGKTNPDWIAMDLFSQAEHDEIAQAILLCPDMEFIQKVKQSIERQLTQMPRHKIIAASLANRGALIQVKDLDEACLIANQIAPEHLELSIENPDKYLPNIRHAGAIFIGKYTSEALGDYCAGPNHVLPTSGTARFASPLGVYDFQKRTSLIRVSEQGVQTLGKIASILAHKEGLSAHAQSAEYRLKNHVTKNK